MTLRAPDYLSPDGSVKLWCDDCLAILPEMEAVDCVITDPPYGVGLGTKRNNQHSITEDRQYLGFEDTEASLKILIEAFMPMAAQVAERIVLTPGVRNMWLYPRPNHIGSIYYPAATGCNSWGFSCWQPVLFYGKDPYGGSGSLPDSFQSTESADRNGHPCPKPIRQWTKLLRRCTREAETACDPFMGSGTTGVACIKTGRNFLGIEKEPKYFDIAVKRIEQAFADQGIFTGAMA